MDGSSLFTMESCFRIHHLTFVSSNCDSLRSYNMTCFLISISIYLLRDWNRLLFANLIIETFRLCAVEPQLLTRWSYITTVGFLCQQSKLRFKRALCQWSTVSLDTHSEVHTHTQTNTSDLMSLPLPMLNMPCKGPRRCPLLSKQQTPPQCPLASA